MRRLTKTIYIALLLAGVFCVLGDASSELLAQGNKTAQRDGVVQPTQQQMNRAKAREYFYQGVLQQQAQHPAAAIDLFSHAHALDPESATIAFALGQCYGDLDQPQVALPLLEQAYRRDSTNKVYAQALSSVYVESNRMRDALRINERLLALDPDNDDVRYRLIQLYARTGNMRRGLQAATELQQRFRDFPSGYAQLTKLKIQLLSLTKDSVGIEREYRTWSDRFPEDRAPYYDWMLYLLQRGRLRDFDTHIQQDEKAGRLTPGDALSLRVHRALQTKDYASAERLLERLTAEEKVSAEEKMTLWLELSKQAQGSDDFVAGKYLPQIRKLVDRYPQDSEVLHSYVQLLRYNDRFQEMYDLLHPRQSQLSDQRWYWDELLESAIGLSSDSLTSQIANAALPYVTDDWRLYVILGGDKYTAGDYRGAIQVLVQGADRVQPQTGAGAARLYGLLADLYADQGTAAEQPLADSMYRRAIEANPEDADVLNNYAYRLAKAGKDLELAETYAGQAVKLSPEAAHVLDTYAYILLLNKNYTLARLYQRKALEQVKGEVSADMYEHMGDILLGLAEYEGAVENWTKALTALDKEAAEKRSQGKDYRSLRNQLERKINAANKQLKKK